MMHATQVSLATEDEKSNISRQMNKWLDQVLGPSYHQYCPAETWQPAINLSEDDASYCLVVDLAGVKGEELDLRTDNNAVILTGERETPQPPEVAGTVRMHLMEIDHGRFCREIKLPDDANIDNADAIEAAYRGGFLWVKIPKKTRGV